MLLTTSARYLCFIVLTCLLSARSAAADTTALPVAEESVRCEHSIPAGDPRVLADSLFERGRLLREQGKQTEACLCFEASNEVLPGRGGTLLNVGVCRVEAGALLAARGALLGALVKARTDVRGDRERIAREQLAIVDKRLAWLELVPPANGGTQGVTVTLDGSPVEPSAWPSVPVEPGTHTLSVQAPGYTAWQLELALHEAERRTVFVTQLQPALAQEDLGAHEAAPSLAHQFHAERSHDARPAPRWSRLKTATAILSAASLAVGIFAGSWALERKQAVREHCNANRECDQAGFDAVHTGRRVAELSTAAFTIGGVSGVSWLLLPGSPLGIPWERSRQRSAEARR